MSGARRAAPAVLLLAALGAMAPSAHANGAFPASGQILVHPADPRRIGVRTTYGLVATDDGGASWWWTCEAALGVGGEEHPQLAITPDGVVYGGLLDGLVRGELGGCAWSRAAALEGRRVVDVSQDPSGRAIAAVAPDGDGRAEVWSSGDGAATWSRLGEPLPAKLQPLTLDTAPGGRVYVSGLLDSTPVRGALAWTDDEGATWGLRTILDADQSKAPYIGAIDPLDPDVVWVRLDAAPGELVVTRDGGETWEIALLLEGFLRAFALSPDGSEVIAGGEVDGLHRSPADAPAFEPIASIAARCVQWRDDAIDVCGTASLDGFTVARSTDEGATFAPLLVQGCLDGPVACGDATPVGACAAEWPAIREQLGACAEGGGGGAASTTVGGGGAAPTTTGGGATSAGSSGSSVSGGGRDDAPRGDASEDAGCACRSTGAPTGGSMAGAAAAVALLGGSFRRARRRRPQRSATGGPR